MSTSGESGFKTLFKRSSSSPSTSPQSPPLHPPREPFPSAFLCPITNYPMAEPMVIPTGESFDRISIQACRELNFTPPELSSRSIDFSSPSIVLIPNLALRSAINDWCDSAGIERPRPRSMQTAKDFIETTMSVGNQEPSSSVTIAADRSAAADIFLKEILTKLKETPIPLNASSPTQGGSGNQEPLSASASAQSSEQRIGENPPPSSSSSLTRSDKNLEKKILKKLKKSEISKNESALANLIQLITEEGPGHFKVSLCTPRILAALIPMLQSLYTSISFSAMEAIFTFSLSPSNRIKIVECGAIPALVSILTQRHGNPQLSAKAASAIYNLAISEENRRAIGSPGVMRLLVDRFNDGDVISREEAGLTLCYLFLCPQNLTRFPISPFTIFPLVMGAVNYDDSVLKEEEGDVPVELRKIAVVLLYHLIGTNRGRVALMDINIVSRFLRILRKGEGIEVYYLALLYSICLHDFNGFKRVAIEERAEEVLAEMNEAWGEEGRELAQRMLEMVKMRT